VVIQNPQNSPKVRATRGLIDAAESDSPRTAHCWAFGVGNALIARRQGSF
jgi:hypothetical protein